MPDRTYGEQYRAEHPDWPHECCFAGMCYHRQRVADVVRCESPAACDYCCGACLRGGKNEG